MHRDSGCLDSAIVIVFSTIDNYRRQCFLLSIVLIVFVNVGFNLVDYILKHPFPRNMIYEHEGCLLCIKKNCVKMV